MTTPTLNDLTSAAVGGSGVFDVLMTAHKAHLDEEYTKGRIRGPEYATVYLGSLEATMNTALQFLLQRDKAAREAELVAAQILLTQAQTALATQQTANAVIEGEVLQARKCLLQAEYDVMLLNKAKVAAETALLTQKAATEKAQTSGIGVEPDSVIGKQKALYQAQADGFQRDAEQKATKLLVDTWNVRRTTDEGTVADGTNMLNDATIGRAVTKLLAGVNA